MTKYLSTRPVGYVAFVLFILTIFMSNWALMNLGWNCSQNGPCVIPVWPGVWAPSGVLFAGVALVLRDVIQNLLGKRWTLFAIFVGAVRSGANSPASLVLGSTLAFLFSELADFAVYTPLRKKSLALAILASGLVGSFVDSVIFLQMAFGSLDYILGQVIGKFWMSVLGAAILLGGHRVLTPRTMA